jgi:GNAT superfamily N-acetyltransferase
MTPMAYRSAWRAAACMEADPDLAEIFDHDQFMAYLRRTPNDVLLAALDRDGRVRATAGASLTRHDADLLRQHRSDYQGRGIATAMTARALASAGQRGGTLACLDASAAGRGVHARLSSQAVGEMRFWDRRRRPRNPGWTTARLGPLPRC